MRSMCLLHTSVTWQTDAKGNGEANAKEAGGCQKHRYLPIYFADYEAVVKLADGFNAADLRNVCTEVRVKESLAPPRFCLCRAMARGACVCERFCARFALLFAFV